MEQPDSFPPKGLPTLKELRPLAGWFGVLRALTGAGSNDFVAVSLQSNTIRLCQAAISEYQLGIQAIEAFHKTLRDLTPLHWATVSVGHFESSLWHLERFIKHAKALRSLHTAEMDLRKIIPKSLAIFKQDAERRITRLRHRIAHLESVIQKREFPQGSSIMLRPTKTGLLLGSECIAWAELEQWLRDAYDVSEKLTEFVPKSDDVP